MIAFFIRVKFVAIWLAIIALFLFGSTWLPKKFHSNKPTIHLFTWGDFFDRTLLAQFTKATGIEVITTYYSSNEELYLKLKANQGKGYDLIVPSDAALPLLIKEGLLAPLDKSRLSFADPVQPFLLSHYFDQDNRYSLPLVWEIYGFGYNKDHFSSPFLASWKHIFDPATMRYKITMLNDPVEAINLASLYLFAESAHDNLSEKQIQRIQDTLCAQKRYVEAYVNFRAEYLLSTKNCSLAIVPSSSVSRTQEENPNIAFAVPQEGSFLSIENLAIPAASNKSEYTYQLINYIYQPQNLGNIAAKSHTFPATSAATAFSRLSPDFLKIAKQVPKDTKHYHFFYYLANEQQMKDLWIKIKSL